MIPITSRPIVRGCFAVSGCFKSGRNRQGTENHEETARRFTVSVFLVSAAAKF
jgi:hypothetical protein